MEPVIKKGIAAVVGTVVSVYAATQLVEFVRPTNKAHKEAKSIISLREDRLSGDAQGKLEVLILHKA